jgi:hypothetical protein
MPAVTFIAHWGAFDHVVEPVATWIVRPVMVADVAITVAADVAGGGLAGGLGVDLVAVSGGRLSLAGGCELLKFSGCRTRLCQLGRWLILVINADFKLSPQDLDFVICL